MNNEIFSKLSTESKIGEIIKRVKKKLMKEGNITSTFYLFDNNARMHPLEIEEPFLLEDDKSDILCGVVKEAIKDLKTDNDLEVEKVLYLREGYYNKNHPKKNDMNLDTDFDKTNSNEALIVTIEDTFNFELKVFDCINIFDDGKKFTVISENPIDEIEFCKIDPEHNVHTDFINLIE